MKKIVAIVSTLAIVLSLGLMAGCTPNVPVEDDRITAIENNTIELGLVACLTGAASVYGNAVKYGVDLAVKDINASGDILNGYTVKLTTGDSQSDPTVGTDVFTRMVEGNVVACVGPVITAVTGACAAIANENNMVIVTPSATGDKVTTESDYVFRSCFKDSYQGKTAANYAKELGYTKAAVLYAVGDAYSTGLYQAFVDECNTLGIEIVSTQTSPTISDETTFDPQLTGIVSALGEDGFLFAPYYYDSVGPMIIPTARAKGFKGIIMGVDGMDGMVPDYVTGDLSVYNNVYFTNHYSAESTSEKVQNFIAEYKAEYNADPNSFAALAYDATFMLAKAIEDVLAETPDSISGKALKAKMDGMSFSGVTGDFQLDETGTPSKSVVIIEYYYDEEANAVASRYVKTLG